MLRFLVSRGFVLVVIIALLAVVALSYAVPQSFVVPAELVQKWRDSHGWSLPAVDALGLHHVFTTPWFAFIAALFVFSLAASCARQFRSAVRLITSTPEGKGTGAFSAAELGGTGTFSAKRGQSLLKTSQSLEQVRETLLRRGYRSVSCSAAGEKFVRHPWGFWGNFSFHAGLVIVAAAVLLMVLVQQRGMLRMEEGVALSPDYPWSAEERGLLAPPLRLPAPVKMDRLATEFWENDDTKAIGSRLTFLPATAPPVSCEVSINHPAWYGSLKIYQQLQTGHLFHLRFTDPAGKESRETLLFTLPVRRNLASYNEFRLPELPWPLKGKYFADAQLRGLEGGTPLLVLRFYDRERVLGETRLRQGESGELAGYLVTLERTTRWGGVIFTDTRGMGGIFLGFLVIVLGGLLHYFTVPREAWLAEDGQGTRLVWRAARFAEFYQEEYQELVQELEKEQHGNAR